MRKLVAITAVLGMLAMGCEPVQSICNDAPKYMDAISAVEAENPEFKAELLEDVSEAATSANCPGYNTHDDG